MFAANARDIRSGPQRTVLGGARRPGWWARALAGASAAVAIVAPGPPAGALAAIRLLLSRQVSRAWPSVWCRP